MLLGRRTKLQLTMAYRMKRSLSRIGALFTDRDITEHAADIISAHRAMLESGTLIIGRIVGPGAKGG